MAKIGPTFYDELRAAGVTAGLSWDDERVLNLDQVPPAVRATVEAVLAAHDPQKPAAEPPAETKRKALLAKLDDGIADNTLPLRLRAVFAALKDLNS
ncbi:MAG: hypothetical protein H8K07_01750 [Nitrospira sp.]|nr:hypothetical protein [Nitrospira sp.]